MPPFISVIVPCYNYGRFLAATLDSLLLQTYNNWECIIIDDGSTDNTPEVAKFFVQRDPRFSYHYQSNKGLPGARNAGIALSKGDFIQLLDADDLLQRRKFELSLIRFGNVPEADIVFCPLRYFHDGNPNEHRYSASGINLPWALSRGGRGKQILKYMVHSAAILPPMPIVRRAAMQRVGAFSEDLKSCEDWEYWLRCCFDGLRWEYVDSPDTYALMRLHPNSMTRNRTVMLAAIQMVRQRIHPKLPPPFQRVNQKCLLNDMMEQSVVVLQFEGKAAGRADLSQKIRQTKSFRLKLFQLAFRVLSPRALLLLVKIRRALDKRIGRLYLSWKDASISVE